MGSIVILVPFAAVYLLANTLLFCFLAASISRSNKPFPDGFKVKHLILTIVFPLTFIVIGVLYGIAHLIASDNALKSFLNKPICMKRK